MTQPAITKSIAVDSQAREQPKTTLQSMEVHTSWSRQFRTSENDPFYTRALDFVAAIFGPPGEDPVVDAGCGSATKTLHLARRGYRVKAIDFSAAILTEARAAAHQAGVAERVEFAQEDLTALTLPSRSVQRALCWGVLMHVPDVTRAIAELSRIMAPGGILIISEGNCRSVQSRGLRWLKTLLRRERATVHRVPAGLEYWEQTSTGQLMTRQADIPWFIAEFARNGLSLVDRRAGQFSEIYMILPWKPLRLLVHAFNSFWFRFVRAGGPAYGNLLVFERPR